ncbi:MAG: hypothetical protein M3O62_14895 [Pseudomonadota bacterium]|nr:hypothetical protein [Pseudomonadota bacterium]
MKSVRLIALAAITLGALLPGSPALAQDEQPAIGNRIPDIPATPSRQPVAPSSGTTIIGERESPIGLYIMPWRDSRAEDDLDRPARLLQEKLVPLDEDVFLRQIEYHTALSNALKQKGSVTPLER